MKRAIALLLLLACAGVDPLLVTGESLKTMGHQFADTAAAMDRGLDSGVVTVEQYRAWADFGRGFQLTYRHARELWEAARQAENKGMEAAVARILAELGAELLRYQVLAGQVASFRAPRDGGL